jgi:hypothetical protein
MSASKRLIPLLNRIVVEKLARPTKSVGGIILPESAASKVRPDLAPSCNLMPKLSLKTSTCIHYVYVCAFGLVACETETCVGQVSSGLLISKASTKGQLQSCLFSPQTFETTFNQFYFYLDCQAVERGFVAAVLEAYMWLA